jgi:predicted site-specific integrase-resolvase
LSDALAIVAGVKVPEWAGISGVSRQGATGWLHAGVLAVPARQPAAGAFLVGAPERAVAGVVICAGVLSCGLRGDLGRRVAWLAGYLTAEGVAASMVVCEVGLGRNGHRRRLLSLVRDASAGTVVAGYRECLARFGAGYREAALAAPGRELIVVGQAGVGDDVVRDMAGVCTSLCARLYGRRPAGHRAGRAVAAAGGDQAA